MQGLIFDIKRFAIHDGPGIRTTIFFKGCPLECWWCHNPESRNPEQETVIREHKLNGEVFEVREVTGRRMSVSEVLREIEKERMFMDESGGGVTLSGGEPLMQPEFCLALLRECRSAGIHTTLDTTGCVSKKIMTEVMSFVDLFLYDLKHMQENIHKKYTGVGNKRILENLKFLHESGKNIILRLPVVPGVNDQETHIRQIGDFLKEELPGLKRLDLLPYHKIAGHKYTSFGIPDRMKEAKEPSIKYMKELRLYFEKEGFEVGVGG